MTSMAAALAASLPAPAAARPTQSISAAPKSTQVPQRMEGVVDVEAAREVESVQLNSLVVLKILKHSTDTLPPPNPQTSFQADRNPPPYTELGSHPDALGVLLGLDLDGVLEVEDSFALPAGETSLGANSYSAKLLQHLREVQTPDSQVGIYLSTHNGGFATRVAIELLAAVEKVTGRGKAILVVHDISRSIGGDLSIKAYRMSEGAREATRRGKWDSLTLNENKVTAATLLSTLPVTVSSPSLLNALLSTLTTPAESSSSKSFSSTLESNVILPPTFAPLQNPTDTSLPAYLSSTLDSLLLHNHETNNVAFLQRQIAREKTKHDSLVREREEENVRRKKAGMGELPLIGEFKGAAKDPNRLELVCLTGQVDSLAKNMGAEAAKGLVRAYL